jgi:hypothetical protein
MHVFALILAAAMATAAPHAMHGHAMKSHSMMKSHAMHDRAMTKHHAMKDRDRMMMAHPTSHP